MGESRIEFLTYMSVDECAHTFQSAVRASYSGGRKLLRAAAMVRDSGAGGLEFFTPDNLDFSGLQHGPAFQAGAFVPGYSKMHGPSRMAVHIYVVDHGEMREVQLVGPYTVGNKGSTDRLLQAVASKFSVVQIPPGAPSPLDGAGVPPAVGMSMPPTQFMASPSTPLAGSSRLPADVLAQLEQLGRSAYNQQAYESPWQFIAAMCEVAGQNRDGFLADLAAVVVPAGGWPAYGGLKLLWEVFSKDIDQPDYNATAKAGLEFLRSHGVPPNRLSMMEQGIWRRLSGDETWLVGRPLPPAERLTRLQPGELRQVLQETEGQESKLVFVRQDGPGQFIAVIDGDTEEGRQRWDWFSEPTQHALYERIGNFYQVPSYHWADPDLAPYFPYPPSRL